MAYLIQLCYSASTERLKDKEAKLSGLTIQQFILEDGTRIISCGLDMCFHRMALEEIPNSVTLILSSLTTATV